MLKKYLYINNNKPEHLQNTLQSTLTITNLSSQRCETGKAGIIQIDKAQKS